MKAIFATSALIVAGAVSGYCQAPHRSLASIFNSNLAFYLPAPDSTPVSVSVNTTSGASDSTLISPNTWIEIHGSNLSQTTKTWDNESFANGMPTKIDGVSATVNNKPAAVYYISPTQINVLSPIDTATGPVPVQVTTAFGKSVTINANEQATSPNFLIIDAPNGHVAARHADATFSLLGPAALFGGGILTPAKPNETVLLFATGFGQTSPPFTDELTGSGALPSKPVITIGGLPATVSFAGLSGPGLYQFNVIIPPAAPDGDLLLVATYNGGTTQKNVFIAVQH